MNEHQLLTPESAATLAKLAKIAKLFTAKATLNFLGVGVAAFIGFEVNDYLGREKVSIVNVDVKPLPFTVEIPKDVQNQFDEKTFGDIIRFRLPYDVIAIMSPDREKRSLKQDELKKILRSLSKESEYYKKTINDYNTDLNAVPKANEEKLREIWSRQISLRDFPGAAAEPPVKKDDASNPIKKEEPAGKKDEVVVKKEDSSGNDLFKDARKKLTEDINRKLELTTKWKDKLDSLIRIAVEICSKAILNNADKFQLEVVLFNSGDKQAVIRYDGRLQIDDSTVNLKRKPIDSNSSWFGDVPRTHTEEFLSDFVIIQNKSFNGMTLVVDDFNNRQRDVQVAQRECNGGQRMGRLIISDIGEKGAHQKEFHFRYAVEEENKETLKKFLEDNYQRTPSAPVAQN